MSLVKLCIFVTTLLLSNQGFSYAQEPAPPLNPTIRCFSLDGFWQLDIYREPALINVYDVAQKRLSHTVEDLLFMQKGDLVNIYQFIDQVERPEHIFQANMKLTKNNAYSIDRGKRNRFNCTYVK